uniref:Histone-lysine N-methyltransferase SETMAR n=1 Tax=Strongyloides stercoralis TaxID=6248 RepID=A0AAF5DIU9_STRER
NGDTSLEDKEGRGRNSVLENEELRTLVKQNPCTNVKKLAQKLDVSTGTISNHLKASNKTKKMDTWVAHELTNEQCLRRMEICSSLFLRHKNEPFLERIITCDEKWILYDNRKRSSQYEALPHSPYSPDLSSTDYHIFKHMDAFIKEKKFSKLKYLKSNVTKFFDSKKPSFYEIKRKNF